MMTFLFWFFLVIFILVCLLVSLFVLVQSDKGGGISGAIGGGLGGASSLLGTQDTANILTRGTWGLAGAFMVLCILLSILMTQQSGKTDKSMLQKRAEKQQSYSPSSVLDGSAGLPIKQAGSGQAGAGLPTAAAQSETSLPVAAPSQGKEKTIPLGAPAQAAPAANKDKK